MSVVSVVSGRLASSQLQEGICGLSECHGLMKSDVTGTQTWSVCLVSSPRAISEALLYSLPRYEWLVFVLFLLVISSSSLSSLALCYFCIYGVCICVYVHVYVCVFIYVWMSSFSSAPVFQWRAWSLYDNVLLFNNGLPSS